MAMMAMEMEMEMEMTTTTTEMMIMMKIHGDDDGRQHRASERGRGGEREGDEWVEKNTLKCDEVCFNVQGQEWNKDIRHTNACGRRRSRKALSNTTLAGSRQGTIFPVLAQKSFPPPFSQAPPRI
eukprot:76479-Hanusia_phi.AAC.1